MATGGRFARARVGELSRPPGVPGGHLEHDAIGAALAAVTDLRWCAAAAAVGTVRQLAAALAAGAQHSMERTAAQYRRWRCAGPGTVRNQLWFGVVRGILPGR